MNLYLISDLHLAESANEADVFHQFDRICESIRLENRPKDAISIIFLGDIIDRGDEKSFSFAEKCMHKIHEKLSGFVLSFDFIPGNHDSVGSHGLEFFNRFVTRYNSNADFMRHPAYSQLYDGVNFIFANSNLNNSYNDPGQIDGDYIRNLVREGHKNVLLCHHSFSHNSGGSHDLMNDTTTINDLHSWGISYIIHGHTHRCDVTDHKDIELLEVSCGSATGETDIANGVFRQYMHIMTEHGNITMIHRVILPEDANGESAISELYPSKRDILDPYTSSRIKVKYNFNGTHIPRSISSVAFTEENQENSYSLFSLGNHSSITLEDARNNHHRILLIGDAGSGKTTEMSYFARELYDTDYYPFLYYLRDYTNESIDSILPPGYINLPPQYIVLLFDGYDELSDHRNDFRGKLQTFLAKHPGINVVISSRGSFCRKENDAKSYTIEGFKSYHLQGLQETDIRHYVEDKNIDFNKFFQEAERKNITSLLRNAFFLVHISELYQEKPSLPERSALMEALVEKTFSIDSDKYTNSEIEEHSYEIHQVLSRIAFSMQLMHKYYLDDASEYQNLFSYENRKLVKHSGLFVKEGSNWRFLHNTFREYLAAKFLASIDETIVKEIIGNYNGIRPSWLNTTSYLTDFPLDWDIESWLFTTCPEALVKVMPKGIDAEVRFSLFQTIFERLENTYQGIREYYYTVEELALFSQSESSLRFLLDKIQQSVHQTSLHNALRILWHFEKLYALRKEVEETLWTYCENHKNDDPQGCRYCIYNFYSHDMLDETMVKKLYQLFKDSSSDFIRLGMYEVLNITGYCDDYVDYYIDGLAYIIEDKDYNRIANESFSLIDGLKKMSRASSILPVLQWCSRSGHEPYFVKDIVTALLDNALSLMTEKAKHLQDGILQCICKSLNNHHHDLVPLYMEFFKKTNTMSNAIVTISENLVGSPHMIEEVLSYSPDSFSALHDAYRNRIYNNHEDFRSVVLDYITDLNEYTACSKTIKDRTGYIMPSFVPPKSYNRNVSDGYRRYIDALFSSDIRNCIISDIIAHDPNMTVAQIPNHFSDFDWYSEHNHMLQSLYSFFGNCQTLVKDLPAKLSGINGTAFQVVSIANLINSKQFTISAEQLKDLKSSIITLLATAPLWSVKELHLSISRLTANICRISSYYDFSYDEKVLLDMTLIPAFCFSNTDEKQKFIYLERHLSNNTLKDRVKNNLSMDIAPMPFLQDHIEYCTRHHYDFATEIACSICLNESENDSLLRYSALDYLEQVQGSQFISDHIVDNVTGSFLLYICSHSNISENKKMQLLHHEYVRNPSDVIRSRLIIMQDKLALRDFISSITLPFSLPQSNSMDIVDSIAAVNDPNLLPELDQLLGILMDPRFKDRDWGLSRSLSKAFIACGIKEPNRTQKVLDRYLNKSELNGKWIAYCNHILDEIHYEIINESDIPLSMDEVKNYFNKKPYS